MPALLPLYQKRISFCGRTGGFVPAGRLATVALSQPEGPNRKPSACLATLPAEVFDGIVAHLPDRSSASALAATCQQVRSRVLNSVTVQKKMHAIERQTQGMATWPFMLDTKPSAYLPFRFHGDIVPDFDLPESAASQLWADRIMRLHTARSENLTDGCFPFFPLAFFAPLYCWATLILGRETATWQLGVWIAIISYHVTAVALTGNIRWHVYTNAHDSVGLMGRNIFTHCWTSLGAATHLYRSFFAAHKGPPKSLTRYTMHAGYAVSLLALLYLYGQFASANKKQLSAYACRDHLPLPRRMGPSRYAQAIAREQVRRRVLAVVFLLSTQRTLYPAQSMRSIVRELSLCVGAFDWHDSEGRDPLDLAIANENKLLLTAWCQTMPEAVLPRHLAACMALSRAGDFFPPLHQVAATRAIAQAPGWQTGLFAGTASSDDFAWKTALLAAGEQQEALFLSFYTQVPIAVRRQRVNESNALVVHGSLLALWCASRKGLSGGYQPMLQLLNDGADPNLQDGGTGVTPLHLAVAANQPAKVSLLLTRNANRQQRDHRGLTPIDMLRYTHAPECHRLLRA